MLIISKVSFFGFFPLLLLRIIFLLRRKNFFFIWASMELNLIRIIPLLRANEIGYESEVVLKYFLVQAWGSIVLLWRALLRAKLRVSRVSAFLTLALFLKLGVVPFHTWFIRVIKILTWKIFILLSTIQKFIPLYMLHLVKIRGLVQLGILLCCLRAFIVRRLKMLKHVIAISSVFSLAWLLRGGLRESGLWVIYLGVYTLGLCTLVVGLEGKSEGLSLRRAKEFTLSGKVGIFFAFMILAGLPPFIGFIGKIIIFSYMAMLSEWLLMGCLLFGAIWIILIYIRIRFLLLMGSGNASSWETNGTHLYRRRALIFLLGGLPLVLLFFLCLGVLHIKFWILRVQRDLWYISTITPRLNLKLPPSLNNPAGIFWTQMRQI